MSYQPVRDAYSFMAKQYILFDGDWHEDDAALIRRHLTGLPGPVLDLGCAPGHWTAYLHSLGVDVTGIDMVPEFIDHARANHPGPTYRLGSMIEPGKSRPCIIVCAHIVCAHAYSFFLLHPHDRDRCSRRSDLVTL